MEVHVPHDVILNHILTRVPVKTVGRFRCVSKEWHSLLTWDMLRNMHIDHHQINGSKLLVISASETSFEFTTIDCEAPLSDKGLTPTRRPLPPFEGITPGNISILASFHGLVCLRILNRNIVYSHIILWNPLTNEYKRLSESNSHKECNNILYYYSNFGLYYSSCEDDYKLLFVKNFYDNVYIYSLKSDSWRKVDDSHHTGMLYSGHCSRGTFLNENLYFLKENSNGRYSIIRFDTKTERWLSKIETPYVYANSDDYFATIMVISDCIHVCVKYDTEIRGFGRTTCIKLWKLDDEYGNMKEVATYQLRPYGYNHTISYLVPFHLMKNGNWLMRNRLYYDHKIYKIDLKKQKHIKDNIFDVLDEYPVVRVDGNYKIADEEGRYIETFVSPNRYMK